MREPTCQENAWEEGYAAGKKDNMTEPVFCQRCQTTYPGWSVYIAHACQSQGASMTEPTRKYEQMEYGLKIANRQVKLRERIINRMQVELDETLARVAELEHVPAPGEWGHTIFACPECSYSTSDLHTATVINDMCNACPECDTPLITGDKHAWCNLQHPAGDCGWYAAEIVGEPAPDSDVPIWQRGYRHGLAQCNHHPEALTREEYGNQIDTAYQSGHDVGVADGNGLKSTRIRDLERKTNRLEALETSRKVEVADLERQVGRLRYTNAGLDVRIADLVRLNTNQSEIIDKGTFDEGNEEGYADGLAQGRREMALKLQGNWQYTRGDHEGIEEAVDAIGEKISELQGMLTAIETLR